MKHQNQNGIIYNTFLYHYILFIHFSEWRAPLHPHLKCCGPSWALWCCLYLWWLLLHRLCVSPCRYYDSGQTWMETETWLVCGVMQPQGGKSCLLTAFDSSDPVVSRIVFPHLLWRWICKMDMLIFPHLIVFGCRIYCWN